MSQFVTQYYSLFDTNRSGLKALYVSLQSVIKSYKSGVLYNAHLV